MRKPTHPYYSPQEQAWIQARIDEVIANGSRQSDEMLRAGFEMCLNARLVAEIADFVGFNDVAQDVRKQHLDKRFWNVDVS